MTREWFSLTPELAAAMRGVLQVSDHNRYTTAELSGLQIEAEIARLAQGAE